MELATVLLRIPLPVLAGSNSPVPQPATASKGTGTASLMPKDCIVKSRKYGNLTLERLFALSKSGAESILELLVGSARPCSTDSRCEVEQGVRVSVWYCYIVCSAHTNILMIQEERQFTNMIDHDS